MEKTQAVLIAIVIILIAIIAYFVLIKSKLIKATSIITSVMSSSTTVTTPSTTIQQISSPLVTSLTSSNGQITIPLTHDKWVVVVSPTAENQYFSAYLSMTGKVDSTAIQIATPTVISSTSLFLSSSNFSQYAGYPYLIINSSAPFTVYIGYALP